MSRRGRIFLPGDRHACQFPDRSHAKEAHSVHRRAGFATTRRGGRYPCVGRLRTDHRLDPRPCRPGKICPDQDLVSHREPVLRGFLRPPRRRNLSGHREHRSHHHPGRAQSGGILPCLRAGAAQFRLPPGKCSDPLPRRQCPVVPACPVRLRRRPGIPAIADQQGRSPDPHRTPGRRPR
jgi:hypothetical protein